MTAEAARTLSDHDLRALLLSVGLDPARGPEAYDRTFTDLDLDSLARVELASRIKTQLGLEIEDRITAGSTPAEVAALVNELVGARAGAS